MNGVSYSKIAWHTNAMDFFCPSSNQVDAIKDERDNLRREYEKRLEENAQLIDIKTNRIKVTHMHAYMNIHVHEQYLMPPMA